MVPRRIYMFLLDILLFTFLILLLSPFSTGLSGHEMIGTYFLSACNSPPPFFLVLDKSVHQAFFRTVKLA